MIFADGDSLTEIITTTIGFSSFLFIGGVSLLSILFNLVMKKMESEKKALYCVDKMKKELRKIGVRGDPRLLRVMYDQYTLMEVDDFIEELS